MASASPPVTRPLIAAVDCGFDEPEPEPGAGSRAEVAPGGGGGALSGAFAVPPLTAADEAVAVRRGLARSELMPQYRASAPSSSAICARLNSAKKNAHMPASSAYRARRWAGSVGSQPRGPAGPPPWPPGPDGRVPPGPVPKPPLWPPGWRLLRLLGRGGGFQ